MVDQPSDKDAGNPPRKRLRIIGDNDIAKELEAREFAEKAVADASKDRDFILRSVKYLWPKRPETPAPERSLAGAREASASRSAHPWGRKSKTRQLRSERDQKASARRNALGAIVADSKGRPTTEFICKRFDFLGVAVPPKYAEQNIRCWLDAYQDPKYKNAIGKMISNDITMIRNRK